MHIIKQMYALNGLTIKGGGACPEQYDVFHNGAQVAYYRLRHGTFTVSVPDGRGEDIMTDHPIGDGIFTNKERILFLTKAMNKVLENIEKK